MLYDAMWFYKEFVKNVTEEKYEAEYRYNEAAFTKSVITEINKIIETAKLTPQNEYYRIDAVGWRSRYREIENEAQNVSMKPHLWDLEIVVEHENSKMDWSDELIKLAYIRCPLKVIICYNYCNCRNTNSPRSDSSKLTFAVECLKKLREPVLTNDDGKLLIIIGNAGPYKSDQTYEEFDYKGYLLKNGAFIELEKE